MADNTALIETIVDLAMMGDSGLAKLKGIKSVRTLRTYLSLQLYIICNNGDIIEMCYVFGTHKIYTTLVGMHRSNDASIPVCSDKYASEVLICKLMYETLYPVASSNRLSQVPAFYGYSFWHRGHAVYCLKLPNMDIRTIKYAFRRLVEDVLRMHKDGTLLDIAAMKVDQLPKEITKEWILC